MDATTFAPRLQRLARRAEPLRRGAAAKAQPHGRCDLCAGPLPEAHRHLLDRERREVRCACGACALLLDPERGSGGRHRLLPDRLWRLGDLGLGEADWRRLGVPVGAAFLLERGSERTPVACYPGPLGIAEGEPDRGTWRRIVNGHAALAGLEPDVEALLVDRRGGRERTWLASLDVCLRVAACLRTHWRGFSGGRAVWRELDALLDEIDARARMVRREDVTADGRLTPAARPRRRA